MSATELLEPVLKGGIRSINFFNGRLLSAEDLSDEQAANRQARALLGQAIGEGVAYGFEVVKSAEGSVVNVSAGLAFNRRGDALRLPTGTDVALSRQTGGGAVASVATFKPCDELQGGVFATDVGVYLLTAAPADGREGRAPSSGLGNTGAPCAARYTVEGVQFRLVQLLKSTELGDTATLRNRLAYDCFGSETLRQFEAAPFGEPLKRYGLLDTLRPNTLTDVEVPLAVVHWTKQGVVFVDMWSVRRRPARPSATERWGALAGDRRIAEAEAMMLQFQEQVASLQGTPGLSSLSADDRFAYLPPAGLLPVGGQNFNWQTFLGPHAPPEATNLDEGLLRSILARSVFVDPVKINPFANALSAGQAPPAPVNVYRIPGSVDFVLFARSTRGRLRVFLGSANANVPAGEIFAVSTRNNTEHYASSGGTSGVYPIDRLDAGTYNITVNAAGFSETPVAAVVTAGRTTDVPFTAGAPGSILVTVRDKKSGNTIGSKVLTLTATPSQGGPPVQGAPAANDTWQIPILAAGTYTVAVTATGYVTPAPKTVVVAVGQAVNLSIELDAVPSTDAVINLEVSDQKTGVRIDAAVQSVKATDDAGAIKNGAKNASGQWAVSQLAAGTYTVEVTATNYQKETDTGVSLAAGQVKTLPVRMTATPGSIVLNVTHATSGAPINDKVTAVTAASGEDEFDGVEGTDGKWSVKDLPPGTYSVTVTANDFQTKTEQSVSVLAGQPKQLNVAMQPVAAARGSVTLTINDETTLASIDDKVTEVEAESGALTFPGTKGANGKWSIANLLPGTYSVRIAATSYQGKTVSGVEVASNQVKSLIVALRPLPGSIALSATDSATGAPIDNKVATLSATGAPGTFTGAKGADGKWSIPNVPPGTYTVTVTATNYQTKTLTSVAVVAGTAKALSASMVAVPGTIALSVNVTGTGAAADSKVTSVSATGTPGTFTGSKGANGKWSIADLPPGTYSVTVIATGYDTKTTPGVGVTAATTAAITVTLSPDMNQPSTTFGFTRGHPSHQHTEHDHFITASLSSAAPPTGTLSSPDTEARNWMASWRNWFSLVRPDVNIDTSKEPMMKVTSTRPVGDETVESQGFVVLFRADNSRIPVNWEKRVRTVFPGTDPQ
ncbi:MAG TPA: carboxypeptidase regulatory-like domain-containing protein [Pyrinomonadaceae bacterium]|nr:carboxypeptidase regulatory-like domain-containing protein [Pyrinomonadaceae bacterium]